VTTVNHDKSPMQGEGSAGGDGRPGTTDAGTRAVDAAPDPRYLVTVPEAGRLLGIGRTRAFRLVNSNYLMSVKIGRSRLVPTSAIRALVEELIRNPNLLSRF
jgi:excisionase family DNA binding protein